MSAERIVEGTVVEILPHALFRVAPDEGRSIVAHLSDDARVALVHLRPGQRVRVALSAYDTGRGRILARVGEA